MIRPELQASISVAMCTCNGERYLREQLDSISAQTRLPTELVVCDDKSVDTTLEILELFAQQAPFPVHIFKNPVQLGSTRNFDKAVRLCQGEYIALSDQDDRWKMRKLAVLGGMLDADHNASMAFSNAILIDGSSRVAGGTLWESLRFGPKVQSIFAKDAGRVLLERPVVTGATLMFRRSLLQYFRQIPSNWVHDGWITWMSTLWARSVFTPESLTEYRIHVNQQLGVGGASVSRHVGRLRRGRRIHYAKVAVEFEDLLSYVENSSCDLRPYWEARIKNKAIFLNARANAPSSFSGRFLFLLHHFSDYTDADGSNWRSLVGDFLMGQTKSS